MIKLTKQEIRRRKNEHSRKKYHENLIFERKRARLKNTKRRLENPEKCRLEAKRYSQTTKGILKSYRANAKKRGLSIEITLVDFGKMLNKKCFYCGDYARGLDRKDNTIGYISGNLLTCCGLCNWMKRDLTIDDFLNHIRKISKRIPDPEKIV